MENKETKTERTELDRILWDIPRRIETNRLIIRAPQRGDSVYTHEVKNKNLDHLKPWFPWVQNPNTIEKDEIWIRQSISNWEINAGFTFLIFDKKTGDFLGSTGLHCSKDIYWEAKRFEIGYWLDQKHVGKGIISESSTALTLFAFDVLKAKTVIIRANTENQKSRAVPKRLGFKFNGSLTGEEPHPLTKEPMDLAYYSRTNTEGLPKIEIKY